MIGGKSANSSLAGFPQPIKPILQVADFIDSMVPRFESVDLRTLYERSDGAAGFGPDVVERFRFCVYCLSLAPDERAATPMKCLRMSEVAPGSRRYALRLTEEFELIARFEEGLNEQTAVIERIQPLREAAING